MKAQAKRHARSTEAAFDGLVAGIATANGCAGATRDTRPFTVAGLDVIDPWASS